MHLRGFRSPAVPSPLSRESQEPIRTELLSPERLEELAERVASRPVLAGGTSGRLLSPRVRDSGRVLLQCYREIAAVIREEGAITPAAEWFVDNYHVADEVVRQVREDLPRGFYRQLPKLAEEPLQGYPRVLGLAWEFIAHTDSRLEPETLQRFVRRFQRVQPLTIGELWAIPIALRLVLVENLRRLAERIVNGRAARLGADALADELLGLGGRTRRPLAFQRIETARLSRAFMVNLVQRLREQDPESTPALRWLDEQLTALGTSADALVQLEHQNQAALNVTVRNVITSMRMMATFDWADFFESVSLVDDLLRADRTFRAMDFATRDQYRHVIEDLARGSRRSELDVTRLVMAHARRAIADVPRSDAAPAARSTDPGYYLLAQGRTVLEAETGYRAPPGQRFLRVFLSGATPGYLTTIATVTGLLLALPLLAGHTAGMSPGALALLGLLAVIPASDLALALINRAVMDLIGPTPLPRLELAEGVPAGMRTLVVVPTLLTGADEIEEHINRLEIHYLANPDGHVHFVLLSDWRDASTERTPEDDRLLALAADGIARLNARSGPALPGGERFLLLHRRRAWNAREGTWMGWERKRGKLDQLNQLLTGTGGPAFETPRGPAPAVPTGVRYVITLDADTRLPRGAVNRLVGTMAHPLNRPVFDARAGRVVDGYAILQPRITPTIPSDRDRSLFQRIFAGPAGIDPYATATSDVYQDLFGEGSYTGKGIYDVAAFTAALKDRVPENSLLSHDLFEGIFARAGLVTDIELFEEFPTDYEVAAGRQYRWARGDWQLLPWMIRGDTRAGARPTWIPPVGLWKITDNLRRTLSAPAAGLTLIVGWLLPHGLPLVWTAFVLATIALPSLLPDVRRDHPQAVGHLEADPLAERRADLHDRGVSDRARHHLPRAPGLAHGRRDRTHARAPVPDPPPAAGMDHRRADQVGPLPGHHRRVPAHGRGARRRRGRRRARGLAAAEQPRGGRALPPALEPLPRGGPMGQPPAGAVAPAAALPRGLRRPSLDRAPHLALLRVLRRARRHLPAARQLPGGSPARPGAPHVSHQHRALSAGGDLGPGLRLAGPPRHGGAPRGDPGDDAPPRALPRPLLQLVRHDRAAPAGAPLRLHRGQR